MKKALITLLALAPFVSFAQGTTTNQTNATTAPKPILVSVKAKATDVRAIISDLFGQAKLNYVLEPGIQASLFLSLENIEFADALNIICIQAHLQFELKNGIYFVSKKPVVAAAIPLPKGTLDKSVLLKKVTVSFEKADLRRVLAEFGKQTETTIVVDKSVPRYRLDATLKHATLQVALKKVTEAAGLKFKLTDNMSILIYQASDDDKVAVSGN